MKRNLTFVLTVLALVACLITPMGMNGQTTETTQSVTLSSGTFSTDHITWTCGGVTIQQLKGSSSTAVNSSYISAPRVYKGHVLSFVGSSTCKIKQIEITVNGTYYGNSMTAGTVFSNNTVTDNTTDVARTWTSTSGGTHVVSSVSNDGLEAIYIQNVASTNVQLRFTALSITYITSGNTPTTYTVTYDAGDHGTGTMTDSNSPYEAGDQVTLLANAFTPDNGYQWDSWEVKDANDQTVTVNNGVFTMPASDVTVTAQWTQTGGGSNTGSITITQNEVANFTNTYDWYTWTSNSISGQMYAYKNSGMQFNSSKTAYWVYNTTAIPGRITSITMTKASGTDRNWTLKVGNSALTTTNDGTQMGQAQTVGANGATWNVTGNYDYFLLYVSGGSTVISSIVINYETVTSPTISFNPDPIDLGNVLVGQQITETFTVAQANLTAGISLSADVGSLDVNSINQGAAAAQVTWTYTPATAGPISATVTATSGTLTETLSITGAAVTPMTVAQAITAIGNATGHNVSDAYVEGIISYVDYFSQSNHYITYYISDDGTRTDELEVYHGMGLNGADFTAITDLGQGDQVVVHGDLTYYNNTTYEFTAGSELISLTPHQAQQYTLEVTSVTNAEIFVFDATDPDETNWVYLFDGEDDAQVLEGTPIALSVEAEQGYLLTSLIVDGVEHLGDIDGGAYVFNMPTHNVTVTATAVPVYNITYSVNGVATQAEVLASFNLPTSANLTNDVLFAGWTYAPYDIANIMPAGTTVTVQGGETFYAVYSVTTTTGGVSSAKDGASYVKVTEVPTDGWEGDYLIVYEDFAIEGFEELEVLDSHYGNTNANTYATYANLYQYYNDGVIEYNATTSSYAITVAETTNGYSLYDNDDEAYLGNSSSNTGAKLRWDTEFQSNRNEWTLGVNSIVSVYDDDYAIRWNNTAPRFAIYGTSGQSAIQLYKYTDGSSTPVTTTAYYTRVFMDETATAAMSITGPSYIPSGYYLDMDGNTLTNGMTADSLVIADGGQYMGNSVVATMQKVILPYSDQQGVNDKWYAISMPFTQSITPGQNNYMVDMVTDVTGEYSYDFYRFDNNYPGAEWRNFRLNGGFSMTAGQGYLYAHKHGIILNFTGTLNATTANVTSAAFSNGNTYMANYFFAGNPFSCQATILNHSDFFVMNAAGTDFVLDSDGILEPLQGAILYDANAAANYTITYVSGTGDNESIVDDGELFKAIINLSVTKDRGEAIDVARVRFGEGLQIGKFQLDPNNTRIYFTQNGKEYAVVRSDAQGELPVGFHAGKNGTYTVNVETENVEMFYLHLVDNMTGADVDLLQTPSYTFEANSGDNANRFRLVFDANAIEEHNAEASFAYFNGSEWVISNMGDATLQVIDIMGRVLSSETINDDAKVTIEQVPGVYMLRLVNGNDVKVQKVVVK